MKDLSEILLSAQRTSNRRPYVTLKATNKVGGVICPQFARFYTGSEPDGPHAIAVAGDGSLIRGRVSPPEDGRRLFRQRVANPGPGSDFSGWEDTGRYDVLAAAIAVYGSNVSLFWIEGDRAVYHQRSLDYGATWQAANQIGTTTSTVGTGIAAAYRDRDSGDIAVFITDMEMLDVKKYENGEWQPKVHWDKSTGYLSGVGAIYDGDWKLMVTGQDVNGNFRAWSLVYGDGEAQPAGTWSDLVELASADALSGYEYRQPFLVKTDVIRASFLECYTGTAPYYRPRVANTIPGSGFAAGCWSEPFPFNLTGESGLALAVNGDALWLACPSAVFMADLSEQTLDLSADILSLREERRDGDSGLTVELANASGVYNSPGSGALSILETGCGLELGLGYLTPAGAETGILNAYRLEAIEHVTGGGKASLSLRAAGGWETLENWRAQTELRWNPGGAETASILEILTIILARAGIPLEVKSASAALTGLYPDFTVLTGDGGREIVRDLLSLVPDALVMAGDRAYLVDPGASDDTVYGYGAGHDILAGHFSRALPAVTRVRVEGWDETQGAVIIVDSYDWDVIERGIERILYVRDRNIGSEVEAAGRGEVYLGKAAIRAGGGLIRVPANCGQELYDIVEVTEGREGLAAARKRVLGIETLYDARKGVYEQKLHLGAA